MFGEQGFELTALLFVRQAGEIADAMRLSENLGVKKFLSLQQVVQAGGVVRTVIQLRLDFFVGHTNSCFLSARANIKRGNATPEPFNR